jgi:hypothetical protein
MGDSRLAPTRQTDSAAIETFWNVIVGGEHRKLRMVARDRIELPPSTFSWPMNVNFPITYTALGNCQLPATACKTGNKRVRVTGVRMQSTTIGLFRGEASKNPFPLPPTAQDVRRYASCCRARSKANSPAVHRSNEKSRRCRNGFSIYAKLPYHSVTSSMLRRAIAKQLPAVLEHRMVTSGSLRPLRLSPCRGRSDATRLASAVIWDLSVSELPEPNPTRAPQ